MAFVLSTEKYREPAECVIRLGTDEGEIDHLYPFLTYVTVECSRRQASVATLVFESRRDEQGRWSVQDDDRIRTWQPISITAVFGSYSEPVFSGFVREIQADYPIDAGDPSVVVRCQDLSLMLDRQQTRRVWGGDVPTSDAAILTEILVSRHNLKLHPRCGSGQSGLVLNQNSTDIRFLRERAEANGYELFFSQDWVYFGPLRLDSAPQETILVYAGRDTNCYRFSVRSDGHQPDKVAFHTARTDGPGATLRELEADLPLMGAEPADSSLSGMDDFLWYLDRHGSESEEGLAARAQRHANDAAMKVKAEGELDGSLYGHVLRVGEPVGVDGVGQRFSGIYYVDNVLHQFDLDGYRQELRLLRNAFGENPTLSIGSFL